MIQVDGYKMFRGVMRITPINPVFPQKEIYGDWMYKPEYDCWYGNGQSFLAEICEVVTDETCSAPQTNYGALLRLNQDELRTSLIDYFYQWAECADSYIYDLTRVKEAFAIGTMSFDDFEPWGEERVTELVDDFLEWLKEPVNRK